MQAQLAEGQASDGLLGVCGGKVLCQTPAPAATNSADVATTFLRGAFLFAIFRPPCTALAQMASTRKITAAGPFMSVSEALMSKAETCTLSVLNHVSVKDKLHICSGCGRTPRSCCAAEGLCAEGGLCAAVSVSHYAHVRDSSDRTSLSLYLSERY